MLRALIRYLFFTVPSNFLRGLEFILFDKEEIVSTGYTVQDQINKIIKERKILLAHIERCAKEIKEEDK